MHGRTDDADGRGEIRYALAKGSDLAAVRQLLSACALPHEDVDGHAKDFLLAWSADSLVASVGLEIRGTSAFLRSLAVEGAFRGRGIASELCRRITAFARNAGAIRLYLLTTVARPFFERRGFAVTERASAPPEIRATSEFTSTCPSTATCMTRELSRGVLHLQKELLPLRPDVPGASMWAVSLERAMLTYFEVEPHTRFEEHSHPGEQITTVVEGELFFEVGGELLCLRAGDVVALPALVPHAVFTRERGARAFDAWSPPPQRYDPR